MHQKTKCQPQEEEQLLFLDKEKSKKRKRCVQLHIKNRTKDGKCSIGCTTHFCSACAVGTLTQSQIWGWPSQRQFLHLATMQMCWAQIGLYSNTLFHWYRTNEILKGGLSVSEWRISRHTTAISAKTNNTITFRVSTYFSRCNPIQYSEAAGFCM